MTVAAKIRQNLDHAQQEASRLNDTSGSEQARLPETIHVNLSKVQRRYLAEICPELTGLFEVDETGVLQIEIPIARMIDLAAELESRKTSETGSRKNAVAKSLKAIEKATLEHCDQLTHVGLVYQLHIELADSEPSIWRRIQVPDCSLFELHEAIQQIMNWHNDHMFCFTIDRTEYYGSPIGGSNGAGRGKNSEAHTLGEVLGTRQIAFTYEYDFGDSWIHRIEIERVSTAPLSGAAKCLAGEQAGPPEDCGGMLGYDELREAMEDPDLTDDDDERLEWYGDFDPTEFDAQRASRRLKQLFR